METAYIVLGFLMGFIVWQAYKRGLEDGLDIKEGKPLSVVKEKKKRPQTKEVDPRTEAILRNIDNYDGTGVGQKKID